MNTLAKTKKDKWLRNQKQKNRHAQQIERIG